MIISSLLLTFASFGCVDLPNTPASADLVSIHFAQDAGHSGYLQGFHTNDTGTYLYVGGKVYRLPPGTPVPPEGVLLTLNGVKKSASGDAHFTASSVSWE